MRRSCFKGATLILSRIAIQAAASLMLLCGAECAMLLGILGAKFDIDRAEIRVRVDPATYIRGPLLRAEA